MRLVIPGWRGRLVFDTYAKLPNGEGHNKDAVELYTELAKQRGLSVPKKADQISNGIRNEIQRLSSDATLYKKDGWSTKRPDLFYQLETGRWGLRPTVLSDAQILKLDEQSILAAEIPAIQPIQTPPLITPELFDALHDQELYVMVMASIPGKISLNGIIVKIGIGNDPVKRQNQLQTGNPCQLTTLFSVKGRNTPALEKKLHGMLKTKQIAGGGCEWFAIDISDIGMIGTEIAMHNFELRRTPDAPKLLFQEPST